MRRPWTSFLVVGVAWLGATDLARAAFTTLLQPLTAELDREAAKLDTATDKASKRRRRALEFTSDDLNLDRSLSVAGDVLLLKRAGRPIERLLGKQYAPLEDTLSALVVRVRSDLGDLETAAGSVVGAKSRSKILKIVKNGRARLDGIQPTKPFAQRVAQVLAAAEGLESGEKEVRADEKCPKKNPPGGHHGVLRATIGDREFSSIYLSTSMVYDKVTRVLDRFVLSGTRDIGGQGDTVSIFIDGSAFVGAGTYVVDRDRINVVYEHPKGVFYNVHVGSVTITSYDTEARDLRGTISGSFVGTSETLPIESAAFESCNWAESTTQ